MIIVVLVGMFAMFVYLVAMFVVWGLTHIFRALVKLSRKWTNKINSITTVQNH